MTKLHKKKNPEFDVGAEEASHNLLSKSMQKDFSVRQRSFNRPTPTTIYSLH